MSKSQSDSQTRSYLSPREMADVLGVTPRTIYNWIHRGEVEAIRIGGVWRIPKSAFDQQFSEEEATTKADAS